MHSSWRSPGGDNTPLGAGHRAQATPPSGPPRRYEVSWGTGAAHAGFCWQMLDDGIRTAQNMVFQREHTPSVILDGDPDVAMLPWLPCRNSIPSAA